MINRRIIINIITFLVLSAVLIAMLFIQLFRVEPKYAVIADFPETGGVFTGQEVTYRGVTVGQVGELSLTDNGVDIELVILKRYDKIPASTTAQVVFKSAVGEQFVDLAPDTAEGPFLGDGSEIPRDKTKLPVQQEELLRLLDQVLEGVPPDAIGRLVDTLGTGLRDRAPELRKILAGLDSVSAVTARRASNINSLNRAGDSAGAAFSRSSADFVAGVSALAEVADTLASSSPDIERLLVEGADDLGALARVVTTRSEHLSRVLANVTALTDDAGSNLESVNYLLDYLPLFVGLLGDFFDGDYFRFGQLMTEPFANPPCRYATEQFPDGTPKREPTEEGSAPYHPHIDFYCLPSPLPALPLPSESLPTDTGGMPKGLPSGPGSWLDTLLGTLPL